MVRSLLTPRVLVLVGLLPSLLAGWPILPAHAQDALTPRRPIPGPVVPPPYFRAALDRSTRRSDGRPGPNYWQVYSEYEIDARLDPASALLSGTETILFRNRSPVQLDSIALFLHQNLHAEGVVRNTPTEVTGGIQIERVRVDDQELLPSLASGNPGYEESGGVMMIHLPRPLPAGGTVQVEVVWSFLVPHNGAGRMGHIEDEMYFMAYWFPKIAVFDDLRGWDAEPYLGVGEFYDGFADYDVRITVPAAWTVMATGMLYNPEDVFSAQTQGRMALASTADTMVQIVTREDLDSGAVTRSTESGTLTYRFLAKNVRDFVWTTSRVHLWTGTSALIPDRDGDGEQDRVAIHTLWREDRAPEWSEQALDAKQCLEYESRFTGIPYPWPHMTSVEANGFMPGGMEYPMFTLIGDAEEDGPGALFDYTSHELGHMWVPMIVGTNEKRHAWMDEGLTSFLEVEAGLALQPEMTTSPGFFEEQYFNAAQNGLEQSMMRHHDYYEPGPAGNEASYSKPSLLLSSLRSLLGEEAFMRAYRTFLREWSFKHPTPWDFFNTIERVAGQDLDWFWNSWYYETWVLDQAVESVTRDGSGTVVTIVDRGFVPMPTRVRIETADGGTLLREIPVEHWLRGETSAQIRVPGSAGDVLQVEIDPDHAFLDIDRTNNSWGRG